jgi:cell wall-associated NlpC family hydrolase
MFYMKCFKSIFVLLFFTCASLFAQEKFTKHIVSKNETISQIARKYNVKSALIYQLNPDATSGIRSKMILLIPIAGKSKDNVLTNRSQYSLANTTHEVQSKETIYGIAKQYCITVEDLYSLNPVVQKEGLKIGQVINLPANSSDKLLVKKESEKQIVGVDKEVAASDNKPRETVNTHNLSKIAESSVASTVYLVKPKESLYLIAKMNGIKLSELQNANPSLFKTSLKVGQKITIPSKSINNAILLAESSAIKKEINTTELPVKVTDESLIINSKTDVKKTIVVGSKIELASTNFTDSIAHKVLPKESLYSIAKKYQIKLTDLKKANARLDNKSLRAGQIICVPIFVKSDLKSDGNAKVDENEVILEKKDQGQVSNTVKENDSNLEIIHEVLPKETIYGIAKKYGMSVDDLVKTNPSISKKLLVGAKLTIRDYNSVVDKSSADKVILESSSSVIDKSENIDQKIDRDSNFADLLIMKASENLGTPYRGGGTTRAGFDCSGLMFYTFNNFNITLPRSSSEMSSYGSVVNVQEAQKGDLIFFRTRGSHHVNHVGMIVEVIDGELKFIHSATRGGVIISSLKESYYEKNFVQVNRVF